MTFDQYVSEGQKALAEERNAGQRLSELAAGVEHEYGRLVEWAEAIGINHARAYQLRDGGKVNDAIRGDTKLPWTVAAEAVRVPAEKLPQVIERAVEVTRQWQPEATTPSLRGMREAAKRYSKPRGKTNGAVHEAADHALVALGASAQTINEALVLMRDGEITETRVRAGCNLLDKIERDAAALRELLVSNDIDAGLAALLGGE